MNAATRAINSRTISLPVLELLPLSRQAIWLSVMLFVLLISALGIIYTKDLNRRLFIQEQQIKHQDLLVAEQWSKLLLEQGTLIAQPRVQKIAEKQLDMLVPARIDMRLVSN